MTSQRGAVRRCYAGGIAEVEGRTGQSSSPGQLPRSEPLQPGASLLLSLFPCYLSGTHCSMQWHQQVPSSGLHRSPLVGGTLWPCAAGQLVSAALQMLSSRLSCILICRSRIGSHQLTPISLPADSLLALYCRCCEAQYVMSRPGCTETHTSCCSELRQECSAAVQVAGHRFTSSAPGTAAVYLKAWPAGGHSGGPTISVCVFCHTR